jgi:hypothetical protein
MEVDLVMYFLEDGVGGRMHQFPLLAFYPGNVQKQGLSGKHWSRFAKNPSVLPVANLMELAYRLNSMIVYKPSDMTTQTMINGQRDRQLYNARLDVNIKNQNTDKLWQGTYVFDFFISKFKPNNTDGEGHKWDIALLDIVDKTEKTELPEG